MFQVRMTTALLALCASLPILAGCGGTGQVSVKGNVTFAGKPIEEGSISFFPEPGTESPKAAAAILNGQYEVPAERGPKPGKFKVEISWMKKTGRKIPSGDPGMDSEETKEAIPAKYHSASTLFRDIVAGPNKLDFVLEP